MGGGPHQEHVLILLGFAEPTETLAYFKKKYPDTKFTYRNTGPNPLALAEGLDKSIFNDATVLVTLRQFPPNPSADSPLLEFVQLFSAGSNQISEHPIYKETDINIATASGIHGPQIAEWVVMTALVQSHKYKQLYELQKKREWGVKNYLQSDYRNVKDMVGQRLGVLGYGSIGRQVARVGKAMGMDVIAYTASPRPDADSKKDRGFIVPNTGDPDGSLPSAWYSGLDKKSLHHFLAQDIDFLLISVPLTKDTRHMLSSTEFDILSQKGSRPAFVTNIARGPIIDQPALIAALKDDTLSGAALDVTEPEPLPSDSELWGMEKVIVTPHVSGVGISYNERAYQLLDQQLERRQKGEKLLNIVKRDRGY